MVTGVHVAEEPAGAVVVPGTQKITADWALAETLNKSAASKNAYFIILTIGWEFIGETR